MSDEADPPEAPSQSAPAKERDLEAEARPKSEPRDAPAEGTENVEDESE